MAKLSREQAKKAIELKKQGETYRDIQEKLVNEYGKESVPSFSSISTKIKPILEGEKTVDEVFSKQKQTKQENKTERKQDNTTEDLEVGDVSGEKQDEGYPVLVIFWVLFFILVLLTIIIYSF